MVAFGALVAASIPVMLAYHIFILSRVKELVDRGEPTTRAVELGIKATAGTAALTSATRLGAAVSPAGGRPAPPGVTGAAGRPPAVA